MKLIEEKIRNLRKKIRRWEYLYYIKNESEISDEEYDIALKELHQLELSYPNLIVKNSPTQCIDNFLQINFDQVDHKTPMLSLNSINSKSQLLLFDKRLRNMLNKNNNIRYCCELKLDGVAVSLLYKKGKLMQAATRGNGRIGENIIHNVRVISSIPEHLSVYDNKKLPYLLEIRGEIFISKLCFLRLNQMMLQKGNKLFSNARNAASGSLRQLNSNITALRPLSFDCYGISYYIGEEKLPDSHWKRLLLCNKWGIPINYDMRLVQGINEVFEYYYYVEKKRSSLKYNIDGIVIKIDSCIDQDKLGFGSKAPNWAIAYKFPAKSKYTKLDGIHFNVGRTGLITPIADIQPIIIDDVTIKKVNIHNINEIKRLDLMIGDTVRVQRSGDVIPKIVEVALSDRSENHVKAISFPKYCPECGSMLLSSSRSFQSSMLRCTARLTCLAQRKAALKHFASRKAINIRGMGDKIIDQLVVKHLVCTPVDFFYLNKEKLLQLDRFGIKSIERLLLSIKISKQTTFSAFIYSLGIPNVGEVVADNLAVTYKTIENLISADLQSLMNVKYVGEVMASDIYSFFKNSDNLKNIYDLIDVSIGIRWNTID